MKDRILIMLYNRCNSFENKSKSAFVLFGLITSLLIIACNQPTPLPVIGTSPIANFKFLNQDSVEITNETFGAKIYVADFFFTSCTTICPKMHRIMKEIFDEYRDNDNVMFLSHTVDFKYDKPSRLKTYARNLGVNSKKWQFAYGTRDQIYNIAENSYLTSVIVDTSEKETYIHQGYLFLVDKNRRIRGVYDSSVEDHITQLKKEIEILLDEEG